MLTFRYRYDGTPALVLDNFGRLDLEVLTENRSGTGGFWVQWQDVKEFGETLGTYPIFADQPLSAEWGYTEHGAHQVVLGVTIAPIDAVGHLKVHVTIADEHDPADLLKTAFRTTYAHVATLQEDLAKLMAGEVLEAVLHGD